MKSTNFEEAKIEIESLEKEIERMKEIANENEKLKNRNQELFLALNNQKPTEKSTDNKEITVEDINVF